MFWHCRNLSHMIAKNRVQLFSSSLSKTKRLDRLHKHFHLVFHRLSKKHCWSWEVRLITTVGWQSKRCSGFQHGSPNIACDGSLRFNLPIKKKTLQLATVSGQLYPKFTTAICSRPQAISNHRELGPVAAGHPKSWGGSCLGILNCHCLPFLSVCPDSL